MKIKTIIAAMAAGLSLAASAADSTWATVTKSAVAFDTRDTAANNTREVSDASEILPIQYFAGATAKVGAETIATNAANDGASLWLPKAAGTFAATHELNGTTDTAAFVVSAAVVAQAKNSVVADLTVSGVAFDTRDTTAGNKRTLASANELLPFAYSADAWGDAAESAATVTVGNETLLESGGGDGAVAWLPSASGTYTATHSVSGADDLTAVFDLSANVAAEAAASRFASAEATGIAFDTRTTGVGNSRSFATDAARADYLLPFAHSSKWGDGTAATVSYSRAGNGSVKVVDASSGESTYTWSPLSTGTYVFTHEADESLTATFTIGSTTLPLGEGTYEDPYSPTAANVASLAAEGKFFKATSGVNLSTLLSTAQAKTPALVPVVTETAGVYELIKKTWAGTGTLADPYIADSAETRDLIYTVAVQSGETLYVSLADGLKPTATAYSGVYDAAAHGITAAAKDGEALAYATAQTGTYSATNPTYKDVTTATTWARAEVVPAAGLGKIASLPVSATVTITAKGVTVAAKAANRAYGAANPALEYTASGLLGDDKLTGALECAATATSAVGEYDITQGTLAAGSNYAISYTGAKLTVTAAAVTVKATAASRAYGAANPTFAYTVEGLKNGDTLTGALECAATATSNVGEYDITQGTLAAGSNYTISYTGAKLTVTPAPVVVVATAASRAYGAANPALKYTANGLVGTDALSGALACAATATSPVGEYDITQGTLSAGGNYTISSFTGAKLTVTPASLDVYALSASKKAGEDDPALTLGANGLVNGETLGALVSGAPKRAAGEAAGVYAIGQGTVALTSGNYEMTFHEGTFTIFATSEWATVSKVSVAFDTRDTEADNTRTVADASEILPVQYFEGATVTLGDDTLVEGAANDGTTLWLPEVAGTYDFAHALDGETATARFVVSEQVAEQAKDSIVADVAAVAAFDTRDTEAGNLRRVNSGAEILPFAYSAGSWGETAATSTAAVAVGDETLVAEGAGEGTTIWTPAGAGTYVAAHAVDGADSLTATFVVSADAAAEALAANFASATATADFDTRDTGLTNTRTPASQDEILAVAYSGGSWALGASGAATLVSYASDAAKTVTETFDGEGTYEFKPSLAGKTWVLTHTAGDETLSARFAVPAAFVVQAETAPSVGDGTEASPYAINSAAAITSSVEAGTYFTLGLGADLVAIADAADAKNLALVPRGDGWLAVANDAKFQVAWLNDDGTTNDVTEVAVFAMPTHADLVKENTAQYTYTFRGWSPEFTAVVSNAIYVSLGFDAAVNSYEVDFVDEDGVTKLAETQTLDYGAMPTAPADPSKENTAQYTYAFAGWTPAVAAVTGKVTYKATYSQTVNKYTITFNDENGSKIKSESLDYGTAIVKPADPTKAGNAQYSYAFAGWTPTVAATVTEDATYTATYTQSVNSYVVKFVDDDGKVLKSETLEYGAAVTAPANPVKENTAQYTYEFKGWTPAVASTVTGAATYKATYSSTVNSYVVQFVDDDGTVLKSDTLEYGAAVTAPADPSKENTAQYTYAFTGWTPAVVQTVEGAATYKATYSKTVNEYEITFVNEDGAILQSGKVPYGTKPVYTGAAPQAVAASGVVYGFNGWTPAVVAVTEDATYAATYLVYEAEEFLTVTATGIAFDTRDTEANNTRTVTDVSEILPFAFEDGAAVAVDGAALTPEFANATTVVWTPAGAGTYLATHSLTGAVLEATFVVTEGAAAHLPETFATATGSAEFDTRDTAEGNLREIATGDDLLKIVYSGGDFALGATGTATVKSWTSDEKEGATVAYENDGAFDFEPAVAGVVYTLTHAAGGETLSAKFAVAAGYTPLADGEKTGAGTSDDPYQVTSTNGLEIKQGEYIKPGIGVDLDTLQEIASNSVPPLVLVPAGDGTYYLAEDKTKTYTVTWKDADGTTLAEAEAPVGMMPGYTGETPTKANTAQYTYTFAGWTPEVVKVAGDTTYTAVYEQTVNEYTVTWLDEDGETVLAAEKVAYGAKPVYPNATPTKESAEEGTMYTFGGWAPSVAEVTGDAAYTATYTPHAAEEFASAEAGEYAFDTRDTAEGNLRTVTDAAEVLPFAVAAGAAVVVNGETIAEGGANDMAVIWLPESAGRYAATHTLDGETLKAVFVLTDAAAEHLPQEFAATTAGEYEFDTVDYGPENTRTIATTADLDNILTLAYEAGATVTESVGDVTDTVVDAAKAEGTTEWRPGWSGTWTLLEVVGGTTNKAVFVVAKNVDCSEEPDANGGATWLVTMLDTSDPTEIGYANPASYPNAERYVVLAQSGDIVAFASPAADGSVYVAFRARLTSRGAAKGSLADWAALSAAKGKIKVLAANSLNGEWTELSAVYVGVDDDSLAVTVSAAVEEADAGFFKIVVEE